MKKKYAKKQLQEAITRVSIGSFQKPIIPGDCPTFDEGTANYVREILKSWVLPKIDEVLNE